MKKSKKWVMHMVIRSASEKDWGNKSSRFRLYRNEAGKPERYPMFHIVSPGRLIPRGISIEDLYIPIEEA